ncbi:MAG TPA: response regulator [Blastocatellia bacterium]|nr:response regulator [Blastocatellia bacterium]
MPIKILLVDDDDQFRAVTAIALESEGCVVQEVADGYAALAALQVDLPDVIVSDLEMPGLDGVMLCRQIRANPAFDQIPFVIISAFFEADGAELPLQHQADSCLSKQLHFRELYRQITSVCRK